MHPLKRIRQVVLRVSQADLAALTGVSQATVSRWETGELAPGLVEMGRIRAEAERRELVWDDSWFFAAPADPAQPAPAPEIAA